jgi:hypothetical protein
VDVVARGGDGVGGSMRAAAARGGSTRWQIKAMKAVAEAAARRGDESRR